MRDAVFMVSPKIENFGSLLPIRPLRNRNGGEMVGGGQQTHPSEHFDAETLDRRTVTETISKVRSAVTKKHCRLPLPAGLSLVHLTQGPVWMPIRMQTTEPL